MGGGWYGGGLWLTVGGLKIEAITSDRERVNSVVWGGGGGLTVGGAKD